MDRKLREAPKPIEIAIWIGEPTLLRTWLEHDIIQPFLDRDIQMRFYCDSEPAARALGKSNFEYKKLTQVPLKRFVDGVELLRWGAAARKMKSVRTSIERLSRGEFSPSTAGNEPFGKAMQKLKSLVLSSPRLCGLLVTLFAFAQKRILVRHGNRIIETMGRKVKFVILPSSRPVSSLNAVLAACRSKIGGPVTIVSIDNWDNISSKTLWPFPPEYLTVMGQTDKLRALKYVKGIPDNRVLDFGIPKFDILIGRSSGAQSLNSSGLKIMYAGWSLAHDEPRFLCQFKDAAENSIPELAQAQLLYRPHPAGKLAGFDPTNLGWSVETKSNNTISALPPLTEEYLVSLAWSDVVIGPPTTYLLEAAIMGKAILIDASDDGQNFTTAARAAELYEHVEDLANLEFSFVTSGEEAVGKLETLDLQSLRASQDRLKNVVGNPPEGYVARLVNFIEDLGKIG